MDDPLTIVTPIRPNGAQVPVVLGRDQADAEIALLDDNGEASFATPGPGPYTVTLVLRKATGANALWTYDGFTGPVIEFEGNGPVRPNREWIPFEEQVEIEGTVTTTAGEAGSVGVYQGGAVLGGGATNGDGTYSATLSHELAHPADARTFVGIRVEDDQGDLDAYGVAEWTAPDAGQVVPGPHIDTHPASSTIRVTASNIDPAEGELDVVHSLRMGETRVRVESSTTANHEIELQAVDPSLWATSDELALSIDMSDFSSRQAVLSPAPRGTASPVAVQLLEPPTFLGALAGPPSTDKVELSRDEPIEFSAPAEADVLRLDLRDSADPALFAWTVTVPADRTDFEPFEVPESVRFTNLPSGRSLSLDLLAESHEPGVVRQTRVYPKRIALAGEESACAADFASPAWALGEWVGLEERHLSSSVHNVCGACELRLEVHACSTYERRYRCSDTIGRSPGFVGVDDSGALILDAIVDSARPGERKMVLTQGTHAGLDAVVATTHPDVDAGSSAVHATYLRPEPSGTPLPDAVVGTYSVASMTQTTYEDDGGTPGAVISEGSVFAAVQLTLAEDGSYREELRYGAYSRFREGVVESFDGTMGVVRYAKTTCGISSDLEASGELFFDAGDVTIETMRRVRHGTPEETAWQETRITYSAAMP